MLCSFLCDLLGIGSTAFSLKFFGIFNSDCCDCLRAIKMDPTFFVFFFFGLFVLASPMNSLPIKVTPHECFLVYFRLQVSGVHKTAERQRRDSLGVGV